MSICIRIAMSECGANMAAKYGTGTKPFAFIVLDFRESIKIFLLFIVKDFDYGIPINCYDYITFIPILHALVESI